MAKELKLDSQIQKAIKDTIKTTAFPMAGFNGLEINIVVSTRTGKKTATFRHRYTHPYTGKRPYMTLGQYPAFSLEQARNAYNDNLALLAKGIDPLEHKEDLKHKEITARKNTLQYFIDEWQAIQRGKNLAPDTYRKQRDNVAYIQKALGKMRVTSIKPATIIDFIASIQAKHTYKGLEVKGVLTAILQLALSHRVIDHNPAYNLANTLKPHKPKHYPSLANETQASVLPQFGSTLSVCNRLCRRKK